MRFLLTLTMICVLFGVSYAQKGAKVHNLGKDADGDTWFLDTSLVKQGRDEFAWITYMAVYSFLNERLLVFYFNVDCSDRTLQFVKAQAFNSEAKVVWEKEDRSAWSSFSGFAGRGASISCQEVKKGTILPVINKGVNG